MKKALSIILSVLVIFSMFSMVAAAADEDLVTVKFMVEGKVYKEIRVVPGQNFVHRIVEGGDAELGIPTKAPTETTEYIFKFWKNEANGHETSAANVPVATEDTVYVAVFAEQEIVENQSLWAFVRTIFERINMIFEYFARVFEGIFES